MAAPLTERSFTTTATIKNCQRKRAIPRRMHAFTVLTLRLRFRSVATNVRPTFVHPVTGATNFRRIMRLESVIDVMHFTAGAVTKWTNVMIVGRLFALHVRHCYRVNFAVGGYVKIARRRVDGTCFSV